VRVATQEIEGGGALEVGVPDSVDFVVDGHSLTKDRLYGAVLPLSVASPAPGVT
jgi:hypothetical protein